jgi:hypothetical protein
MFDGSFSIEDVIDTETPGNKPCGGPDRPNIPHSSGKEPPDIHVHTQQRKHQE